MRGFVLPMWAIFLFLTGCAQQSPPISVPYNYERLEIMAIVQQWPLDARLQMSINGDLVIKETTLISSGTSQNLVGTWRGQQVMARMTRRNGLFAPAARIDVFIEGNLVQTIHM
ncbi:MAG: hypothetical protein AB8B71_15590 [Paracoccaceae bacterium]